MCVHMYKVTIPSIFCLSPIQPPTGGLGRLQDVIRLRKTYREYKSLLSSFACWQQGLEELDQRLKTFMRNYVVVERESLLRDTSAKLEKMAKQAAIVSPAEMCVCVCVCVCVFVCFLCVTCYDHVLCSIALIMMHI